MSLVSIIVPVFNEKKNIVENLDLLLSEVELIFEKYEVIVVSDGSSDGTNLEIFSFQHPNLKPKILKQNQGKGHAVRAGFSEAQGDYVFFIDGGMELHPKELKIFLGLIKLYDADMVIGSKRHPQSEVYYPWYRRFLSWIYQLLVRAMFKVNVTDTQVGIKLFKKEVVDAILPYLQINRYGFDLEIISLAAALGYRKILEAPIKLDYFLKNNRNSAKDLMHVFKVGSSLLSDTLQLYLRLRKIRLEKSPK